MLQNRKIENPLPGSTMYVRSGTGGITNVNFRPGTIPGDQTITVSTLGISILTKTFRVPVTPTAATRQLAVEGIHRQGSTNLYTLVAKVTNGGKPDEGEVVTFTTVRGFFANGVSASKETAATTDANGLARVIYNAGDSSGNAEVIASITGIDDRGTTGDTSDDRVIQLQEVIFNVRGGATRSGGGGGAPAPVNPYLSISVSPSSGTAGTLGTVAVNAFDSNRASVSNVPVTLSATGITFSPNPVLSGSSATFTFPSSTTSVTATANTYRQILSSITVTTQDTTATLTVSPSTLTGGPAATVTLSVTLQGQTVSGVGVTFTLSGASGGAILDPIAIANTSGVATARVVLPSTSGGSVTASATVDGTSLTQSVPITVDGTGTGTGTGTPTTPPENLTPSRMTISWLKHLHRRGQQGA